MPSSDDDRRIKPVGATKQTPSASPVGEAESSADATPQVSGIAAVTQALAAGDITPEQAMAQIVGEVVREKLGPNASPEAIESVRAEVEAMLEGDPNLAALLKP